MNFAEYEMQRMVFDLGGTDAGKRCALRLRGKNKDRIDALSGVAK
jgi:hypothetical protein